MTRHRFKGQKGLTGLTNSALRPGQIEKPLQTGLIKEYLENVSYTSPVSHFIVSGTCLSGAHVTKCVLDSFFCEL